MAIELKKLLDIYEKEGIMNSKLKQRKHNIEEFYKNIDVNKLKNNNTNDTNINNLTYTRGVDVLIEKINTHKQWLKKVYLGHKIMIPIIAVIILVILFFKLANK
jgi:hypothetical protein|tara:strand:- start:933 stop:1244 length:312 start_codon:yes stop_codon:yes gene_type:complete